MKSVSTPSAHQIINFDDLPNTAHIRVDYCATIMGVASATIWRVIQRGELQTYKLTPGSTTIKAGDLRDYIASKKVM